VPADDRGTTCAATTPPRFCGDAGGRAIQTRRPGTSSWTDCHRGWITESVVRDEIRKAAVERRTEVSAREMPALGQLKPAERGLLWALMNQPGGGRRPRGPGRQDLEGSRRGRF
jgi:hypothetical protein